MTAIKRLLFAVLAIFGLASPLALAQGGAAAPVLLAEIAGVIGPPASHQVETAIEAADDRGAPALILQMNTPGGLETSMRDIIEAILAARTPVIVYVAPSGGRAASAGAFILYASHLAAMAPGTNVGAATPVQLTGGGPAGEGEEGEQRGESAGTNADALDIKAVNDAAAFIRSLAELRGRNAAWGESAVRQGVAVSSSEALALGVIEIIAADVDDLLAQAHGREVIVQGQARTLDLEGRAIERVEPGFVTQLLSVIANPNVAFLLMLIGVYGLIYEFASPGSIGPGIIGAVCLVLGLYALNQLPLNYAGLALVILGIGLMAAEAFTPTFGILGVGGAISFLIGAAMLIDTEIPEYQLHWGTIAAATALTAGFATLALGFTVRAHRRRISTGREAMIGARARVLDWADGAGHVWVTSERWRAEGPRTLPAGAWVRVSRVEGLTLRVETEDSGEPT